MGILLGDIRQVIPSPLAEFLLVAVSLVSGALVGQERERAEKPAGLRTLTLICTGSAVFTIMSSAPAFGALDPSRIAAQIVTGVGFLGAGAILRERRGIVVGLTTAASIWVIAAVGMVIGAGYALAGLTLSGVILLALTLLHQLDERYLAKCEMASLRMTYHPRDGKSRAQLQGILDGYSMPLEIQAERVITDEVHEITLQFCKEHKSHRAFQSELAAIEWVQRLESHPLA
jgi:putative Mg2+ transporter-C (MgtC) family protein